MLLVLYLRTLCLSKGHKDFSPMFSPRSAMVFGFIFRSMIHLSPGDILDIRGSIFVHHSGWGKRFNPPLVGQEQDPGEALQCVGTHTPCPTGFSNVLPNIHMGKSFIIT